jgi:hypothetical protein
MNTYIIPQDKLILVLSWSDRHCHQLTEKYMLDFLINIVEDPLYHKDKANPKIQKALYWLRSEIKHIETIPEGEERQFYFCRHYQCLSVIKDPQSFLAQSGFRTATAAISAGIL